MQVTQTTNPLYYRVSDKMQRTATGAPRQHIYRAHPNYQPPLLPCQLLPKHADNEGLGFRV
jgi:hypothetical protein